MDYKIQRTHTIFRTPALIPSRLQQLALVRRESLQSAITILFVAALSHLTFAPWLGYYWDEWLYIWNGVTQTRANLIYQLSWDRPFFAVWHGFVYNFFTDHTLVWHVYFFALVVGSAWLLVWALRGLWPERRFATTAIGLLYAVYPGFLAYPFAHLFHTHYFALAMGILSVGATIRAWQSPNRRMIRLYTLLALVSGITYLFIYEIFISFEVLRLLLIAYMVWRIEGKNGRRVAHVARRWLPYLFMIAVFAFWRLFIFKSLRVDTDVGFIVGLYQQNLLGQLGRIPGELIRDVLETTLFAWVVPLHNTTVAALPMTAFVSVLVGAAGAGGVLLYARKAYRSQEAQGDFPKPGAQTWSRDVLGIGLVTAILALLPVVLAEMSLTLVEVSNRFSLTAIVPIAILVVGVVFVVITPKARPWVIGVLVGLSVITHFNNANYFRNVWNEEMNLWWQMYWRVPALEPETVLVVSVPQGSFYPHNTYEVWGPANIIYAPESQIQPSVYGVRLTETLADQILAGQDYDYQVQSSIQFMMDYDNALILYAPRNGVCLRVLDSNRPDELPQDSPAMLNAVATASHIEQVRANASAPDMNPRIFGNEPPQTWCYYFQKADLARQQGNWERVAALGDMARSEGFAPTDASEWLVFIQGYAAVGRCDDALELASVAIDDLPITESDILPAMCKDK